MPIRGHPPRFWGDHPLISAFWVSGSEEVCPFSCPRLYSIPILHGILRKMASGRKLTEYERGLIDAYHQAGKSNREIARLLRRSLDVVNRYRRNPAVYGTRKPTGRPKTISDRDKSRIMRKTSNSVKTCSAIKKELGLNLTAEWVRTYMYSGGGGPSPSPIIHPPIFSH